VYKYRGVRGWRSLQGDRHGRISESTMLPVSTVPVKIHRGEPEHWGVILGVRAQGVALSPNQPLNYRAQGFWPVTFGVDYTVNYPDFRVRGAMGGL